MDGELEVLSVYPNPYTFIDHKGRAQGVLGCDPIGHTPDRQRVGARVDTERTKVVEVKQFSEGLAARAQEPPTIVTPIKGDIIFAFSREPVTIPDTPYYRQHIAMGDLVIADQDTADKLGVDFKDPKVMMAEARKAALAKWIATYGEKRKARFANEPCPVFGELAKAKPKTEDAPKTGTGPT